MASSKIKLTWLLALTLGGCSQILGIDDHYIDPKLDGSAGEGNVGVGGNGNSAGDSSGAGTDGGGTTSTGGTGGGGDGVGGGAGEGMVVAGAGGDVGSAGSGQGGMGGDTSEPPLGELIPCDSEDCCDDAGGISLGLELLSDGGFEAPPVDSPWVYESVMDFNPITSDLSLGWEPNNGDYYAYLAGYPGERTTVYSEDFDVPVDTGWLVVSGYRWFQIDAEDETNADFALVGFFSYESETAEELPLLWEYGSSEGYGDSPDWVRFEASFDAAPYQGLTTYIGLRGEADEYPEDPDLEDEEVGPASSYLFDDVSFQAFACFERP